MLKNLNCLTTFERILWIISVLIITVTFIIGDNFNVPTYIASVVGVSSLIYLAKGHAFGQILMIAFAIIYGFVSFSFAYYGEVITYVGMTLPMAIISMISWLKNPFKEGVYEVAVSGLNLKKVIIMIILTAFVTFVFYYILKYFNTTNLELSTLSIATSFAAAYLTFVRSDLYAIGYALNDIVLIILWILASLTDTSYLTMVVCFSLFLINDIYGFISWRKMKNRQKNA